VRVDMPRDLIAGMASGRFTIARLELGFDIVAGTVLSAINTAAVTNPGSDYGCDVAGRVLMALGVEHDEAQSIARLEIEDALLPETSLIVRSGRVAAATQ
jgi:hypothetical protein